MQHELLKLTDPAFFGEGNPHALWQQLRAEDPVAWTPEINGPGFWSVTRYEYGVHVFKDWATFSSARGTLLTGNRWEADPAAGKMLALMDPPRHPQIRRIMMNRFFTPRQVSTLESSTHELVRALVRRGSELGKFDFVEEISSRLPVSVFFTMMDIPTADWDSLFHIILRTVAPSEAEQQVANTELLLYFSELVAARRRRPGDDLVSLVATMEISDGRLSEEDAILNCVSLIAAGVDTTRLSAAGGLYALMQDTEQWRLLRGDPALIALAVDEMIRWTSPVLHLYRTATRDVELGERQIKQNDCVVVWIPSLNRDERMFSDPDSFLVSRNPNRHVGFGAGEHLCIGAALARLELRLLFRELAKQWKAVASMGEPKRLHSILVHGIDYLPVGVLSE
jgi:cytochrome P450